MGTNIEDNYDNNIKNNNLIDNIFNYNDYIKSAGQIQALTATTSATTCRNSTISIILEQLQQHLSGPIPTKVPITISQEQPTTNVSLARLASRTTTNVTTIRRERRLRRAHRAQQHEPPDLLAADNVQWVRCIFRGASTSSNIICIRAVLISTWSVDIIICMMRSRGQQPPRDQQQELESDNCWSTTMRLRRRLLQQQQQWCNDKLELIWSSQHSQHLCHHVTSRSSSIREKVNLCTWMGCNHQRERVAPSTTPTAEWRNRPNRSQGWAPEGRHHHQRRHTTSTSTEVKYKKCIDWEHQDRSSTTSTSTRVNYGKCSDRTHRLRSSTTRPSTEVKLIKWLLSTSRKAIQQLHRFRTRSSSITSIKNHDHGQPRQLW